MPVAYLTGVYIYQDAPWYLNILCVRVTCKVHKSRKPGDNCTQGTCHYSWKGVCVGGGGRGSRYLQETIPLGFHQCQLIAEKDEQIPDLTLLLAPLGLYDEVHQALKLSFNLRALPVISSCSTYDISFFTSTLSHKQSRSLQVYFLYAVYCHTL